MNTPYTPRQYKQRARTQTEPALATGTQWAPLAFDVNSCSTPLAVRPACTTGRPEGEPHLGLLSVLSHGNLWPLRGSVKLKRLGAPTPSGSVASHGLHTPPARGLRRLRRLFRV